MKLKYMSSLRSREEWALVLNAEFMESFRDSVPFRYRKTAIDEVISAFELRESSRRSFHFESPEETDTKQTQRSKPAPLSSGSVSFSSEELFDSSQNISSQDISMMREWTPSPSPFPPQRSRSPKPEEETQRDHIRPPARQPGFTGWDGGPCTPPFDPFSSYREWDETRASPLTQDYEHRVREGSAYREGRRSLSRSRDHRISQTGFSREGSRSPPRPMHGQSREARRPSPQRVRMASPPRGGRRSLSRDVIDYNTPQSRFREGRRSPPREAVTLSHQDHGAHRQSHSLPPPLERGVPSLLDIPGTRENRFLPRNEPAIPSHETNTQPQAAPPLMLVKEVRGRDLAPGVDYRDELLDPDRRENPRDHEYASNQITHSPPDRSDSDMPPGKRGRSHLESANGGHNRSGGMETRSKAGPVNNERKKEQVKVPVAAPLVDASGKAYFQTMDLAVAYPRGTYNCRGQGDPGSNFYYCDLKIDKRLFKAGECCYAVVKMEETDQPERAKEIYEHCLTGPDAQKRGKLKKDTDKKKWRGVCLQWQAVIWQHKHVQNVEFRDLTKDLVGKIIVHDTPDEFWGTHRWRDGKQIFGGHNKYGKALMSFIDVIYPEYAADLSVLPEEIREEMESLRVIMSSSLRNWSKIPGPPTTTVNDLEVHPPNANVKIMIGNSIFNDGRERKSKNMILLSMIRDLCGSNIYVAAFPGSKVKELQNKVESGKVARKIPSIQSPDQVSDIILGGGVNDVLAIQERSDICRLRDDKIKDLLDGVIDSIDMAVKAVRFAYPRAIIHISHMLNHPRVLEGERGTLCRDYLQTATKRRLASRVVHFTPYISEKAWREKDTDKLHLSAGAKFEYAQQLKEHLRRTGPFRAQWIN